MTHALLYLCLVTNTNTDYSGCYTCHHNATAASSQASACNILIVTLSFCSQHKPDDIHRPLRNRCPAPRAIQLNHSPTQSRCPKAALTRRIASATAVESNFFATAFHPSDPQCFILDTRVASSLSCHDPKAALTRRIASATAVESDPTPLTPDPNTDPPRSLYCCCSWLLAQSISKQWVDGIVVGRTCGARTLGRSSRVLARFLRRLLGTRVPLLPPCGRWKRVRWRLHRPAAPPGCQQTSTTETMYVCYKMVYLYWYRYITVTLT